MSFMKARKYHVIRIIYSDGKIHHRSFANKHIALRWLAYRKRVSFVLAKLGFGPFCPMDRNERVIYAGTVVRDDIPARLMRKNEALANSAMRKHRI